MTKEENVVFVLKKALFNKKKFCRKYLFDKFNNKIFVFSVINENELKVSYFNDILGKSKDRFDYYDLVDYNSKDVLLRYNSNDKSIIELLPASDFIINKFIDDFLNSIEISDLIKESIKEVLMQEDIATATTKIREIDPKLSFVYYNKLENFSMTELRIKYLPLGINPETEVMW